MEFKNSYLGKLRQKVGNQLLQVPGTRIIIENSKNEILLQKRSDFNLWGLPAGSPEVNESISDCIKREVLEETGLTIKDLNVIGCASDPKYEIFSYPNKDKIHNYSLIFYTKKFTGKLTTNDPETLELKWYKINKLPKMIKNHERTIGYFIKYKESGKFYLI